MSRLEYNLFSRLLALFIILLIYHVLLDYNAFADRPSFPLVPINDPVNDWIFTRVGGSGAPSIILPDGRSIFFRDALSRADCKIGDSIDMGKSHFAFPDISSISYLSDGKTLNSTIWLTDKVDPYLGNVTQNYKALNYSDIFQIASGVGVAYAENKTLNQIVNDYIIHANQRLNNFHFYSNESGKVDSPYGYKGNQAYKIVYSYNGNPHDFCKNCKRMDTLTIENGKLFIYSYYGDIKKLLGFQPDVKKTINVTKLDIDYQRNGMYNTTRSLALTNSSVNETNKNQIRWIGLNVENITPEIAHALGLKRPIGIRAASVMRGSPAEQAGIQGGDKLMSVNGRSVKVGIGDLILEADNKVIMNNLTNYIQKEKSVGDNIKLTVLRDGQIKELNVIVASRPEFFSYQNNDYRLKIQYPSEWSKNESNSFTDNRYDNIVTFLAPMAENSKLKFRPAEMQIIADNSPGENLNVDSYLDKTINEAKATDQTFKLISSNTNIPIGDSRGYAYIGTFTRNGINIKVMEVGAIISDDEVLKVQYFARNAEYETYLPLIQKMIDSFKFNLPTLTYENSYFKIEYPYNWVEAEGLSFPGYNPSNMISSVSLVSPVKGIYPFFRFYGMNIDYDLPYSNSGKANFPYSIVLYSTIKRPTTWTEIIREPSPATTTGRILYNRTNSDAFVQESNGYVLLDLDLDYLHLPNQFYMTFVVIDYFLNNGRVCYLQDNTDFVSSPPPIYAMYTLPKSLEDMRPGDEKDIQVQVKSFTNLAFEMSLSAGSHKNLELTFKPNKTSGVPNDLTTSTLHIKVLPNATAQAYTIPMRADILLTPTYNLNNQTSPQITKVSNFTITVSPPLSLSEQISAAWNGFGPVINGFVGVITALIGIGGVIGGWFLRKFKSKDKDSLDEYRKKHIEGWE